MTNWQLLEILGAGDLNFANSPGRNKQVLQVKTCLKMNE